jgi:PAS domain S-box-containing protein
VTTTGAGEAASSPQPLLPRARTLFVRFLLLSTGVQLIELLDAGTRWWPDRTAAFLGLAVVVGWGLHLHRTQRATWLGDLAVVATFTIIGLGLGRSGAVLVSLISILALRSFYGQRRDAVTAAAGLFVGFAVVVSAHHGPGQLVGDAGFVIVVAAASALAATLRGLGELLSQHDLHARLDEVATAAAARLVAVTSTAEVDRVERDARRQVAELGDDPSLHDPEAVVLGVLRRLAADVRLARQRIGSEVRYRVIAQCNRDGIYLRDTPVPGPDGRYRYLNPAAEVILGLRADDLIADASLVGVHMHEDDLAQVTVAIDEDGLIAVPAEVRWRRPDGVWRWLRLEERVVEVDGEQRQILGMLRDVTSEHEQAAALQRVVERERAATAELRHLDAMKSTFLQAVSHELRTPLSAVIGAAQTLEMRADLLDASQRQRMLEIVQRQSARLERLLTGATSDRSARPGHRRGRHARPGRVRPHPRDRRRQARRRRCTQGRAHRRQPAAQRPATHAGRQPHPVSHQRER